MKKEKNEQKLCINCIYFLQHYTVIRCRLKITPYGQSYILGVKPNQMHKRLESNLTCEHWEQKENLKEQLPITLLKEISHTNKLLEDISLLLKLENK